MLIYRVAKRYDYAEAYPIGPYVQRGYRNNADAELVERLVEAHNDDHYDHPTPWNDPKINRPPERDELCGFSSLAQLATWFDGFLDDLDSVGYRVYVFSVPQSSVTIGEYQVIFDYNTATLVRESTIKERLSGIPSMA